MPIKNRINCLRIILLWPLISIGVSGCGVKGDPLPPEKPVEISHGHANYTSAFAKTKVESKVSTPINSKRIEDDEDQDEKEDGSGDND